MAMTAAAAKAATVDSTSWLQRCCHHYLSSYRDGWDSHTDDYTSSLFVFNVILLESMTTITQASK